jgi:excisionase family DNA binding protein
MRVSEDLAFLTPEEMAVKLRISIRKLQSMIKDGSAPEHIRLGNKVLFLVTKGARYE